MLDNVHTALFHKMKENIETPYINIHLFININTFIKNINVYINVNKYIKYNILKYQCTFIFNKSEWIVDHIYVYKCINIYYIIHINIHLFILYIMIDSIKYVYYIYI